jgi:hypothetical protein
VSRWSEIEFTFESEGGPLLVSLELYASGDYEEPMLEQDGDALIEMVHTPGVPPLICTQPKRIERCESHGIPIHHSARYERNPEYSSTSIPFDSLSLNDRKSLNERIEREIEQTQENHFSEISQHLAEVAADRAYDAWKDRDDE